MTATTRFVIKIITADIYAIIVCAFYALIAPGGCNWTKIAASQHIPDWPSAGQVFYFCYFPIIMIVVLLAALLIFNLIKRSPLGVSLVATASLFPLLTFVIAGGGGV